jgi:hypothetical protein
MYDPSPVNLYIRNTVLHRPGAKRRPRCRRISRYNAANKAGATESPGPQMAMGRIEHTLLDEGEGGSAPTDLRTFAR